MILAKFFGRRGQRVHPEPHGYYTSLIGVDDSDGGGSSPQKEIRKCSIGESVDLVHESHDGHGPSAIAVYRRKSGRKLGFLAPEAAVIFAPRIEAGEPCPAAIYDITGGTEAAPALGIRLRIEENPVQA